jgi:hypothetical protein
MTKEWPAQQYNDERTYKRSQLVYGDRRHTTTDAHTSKSAATYFKT